jgi:hypothetical protein
LEKLGIDLAKGPEFDIQYELVRNLNKQLHEQVRVTSVRLPQKYTGHIRIPYISPRPGEEDDSDKKGATQPKDGDRDLRKWISKTPVLVERNNLEDTSLKESKDRIKRYLERSLELKRSRSQHESEEE